MLSFLLYEVDFCITKKETQSLLKKLQDTCYRNERLANLVKDGVSLPRLKITGDLATCYFFVRYNQEEYRIIFSGTFEEDGETIRFNSLQEAEFFPDSLESGNYLLKWLKQLSAISQGYMYFDIDDRPNRLIKGSVTTRNDAIRTLFHSLPEEKRKEHKELYDWLRSNS